MASSAIITGIGMVSSLGLTAQTSCAAARAGISRARELDYFTQWSPVDGSISPVVGHQIPLITDGFEGDARLARILGGAISDLTTQLPNLPWGSEKLAWYLALPDRYRMWRGAERVGVKKVREELLAAMEQVPKDNTEFEAARQFLGMVGRNSRIPGTINLKFVSRAGNCALAECAKQALSDIAEKQVRYAIVAAVDSLLGEATLNWLTQTSRLKSPAVATGLAPGEAGVALCLQAAESNGREGVQPDLCLQAVHQSHEENTLLSGKPVQGRALTELLESTADKEGNWFVIDLNGEDYRAMEWGYALVRTKLDGYALTYPAVSFGDTGTASPGVAVAVVRHAIRRGCAPCKRAVVLSTSDDTQRTGMIIEAVN